MLIQEGLNDSTYRWKNVIYDCIDGIRNELETHKKENMIPIIKLIQLYKENDHVVICSK